MSPKDIRGVDDVGAIQEERNDMPETEREFMQILEDEGAQKMPQAKISECPS